MTPFNSNALGVGRVEYLYYSLAPTLHPGHLRCADPPLPPLTRGARKGGYSFNKIFKIYNCRYGDHMGYGACPMRAERNRAGRYARKARRGARCQHTQPVNARPDKQGIRSALALSIEQCFGVAVALFPVKNHLATRGAKIRRDGFDDDIAHGDITGVTCEGVGAAARALHRVGSGKGLERVIEPF